MTYFNINDIESAYKSNTVAQNDSLVLNASEVGNKGVFDQIARITKRY